MESCSFGIVFLFLSVSCLFVLLYLYLCVHAYGCLLASAYIRLGAGSVDLVFLQRTQKEAENRLLVMKYDSTTPAYTLHRFDRVYSSIRAYPER